MDFFNKVWSEKYRPQSVDDMVLSSELKDFFRDLSDIPNLLFYGKQGTGKTTMAKILANRIAPDSYLYINASETNGIDVIRNEIKTFVTTKSLDGTRKVVILDEADGLSSATSGTGSSAQGALRNMMEEYLDNVRFILTANYPNKIIKPLLSRCQHFEFKFDFKDACFHLVKILKKENIPFKKDQSDSLKQLVKNAFPDIRKCVNLLQLSCKSGNFVYSQNEEKNEFVDSLYNLLTEDDFDDLDKQCYDIRQFYLNNEEKFNNDYHELMRSLFDIFAVNHQNIAKLLIISDAMEKHHRVMDLEINFFAMIIRLVSKIKA